MNRTDLYLTANHLHADEIVSATEIEMENDLRDVGDGEGSGYSIPGYCTQKTVKRCSACSLCNYGRDCHNNQVAD